MARSSGPTVVAAIDASHLASSFAADVEVGRPARRRWAPGRCLCLELGDRPLDLACPAAHRPRHPVELAQPVVDRAADAGRGERLELHAAVGLEPLDGVDQPEHAGADQIAGIDARSAGRRRHGRRRTSRAANSGRSGGRGTRCSCGAASVPNASPGLGRRGRCSCSRMGLAIGGTEPLAADVSVALGGRNVGVTEQLLHRPEIGPTVEQMRRERVAQRVRVGRASANGGRGSGARRAA